MIVYYVFFGLIGIFIAVVIGINMSSTIESTYFYVLFWMMFILTILTIINLMATFQYYYSMKDKRGPTGRRGEPGERGDIGDAGKCDSGCRDSICYNSILQHVNKYLQQKSGNKLFKLRNVYIKQKIKQLCGSDEFKQIAPYNGPHNLIKYLCGIWENWIDEILNASGGGIRYFETIGAEHDWEWVKTNPFDEIKKYDIFYWGLGPEYRPVLVDKCYVADSGNKPSGVLAEDIIKVALTNNLDKIADSDGMGSKTQASFWRAKKATYNTVSYYPVGDVVYGPSRNGETGSKSVYIGKINIPYTDSSGAPNLQSIVVGGNVRPPVDYRPIWNSTIQGNNAKNIWVWRPIPASGYIAMGDIITTNSNKPPIGEDSPIRCIPSGASIMMKSPINSIVWSSKGMPTNDNIYIIGYNSKVSKNFRSAINSNCYNLFRAVGNAVSEIPSSDNVGSFYSISQNYYDPNDVPGANLGWPPRNKMSSLVGKGYLASPRSESAKYSIQGYLKLKNSAILMNIISGLKIKMETSSSENANAYNIYLYNKSTDAYDICLSAPNNILTREKCNKDEENQYFMLEFTGNEAKQCRVIHKKSGRYLDVNPANNGMKLVKTLNSNTKDTSKETTLFNMI